MLRDRLLAFHQRLKGGAATDRDGRTWVEAVADGWWYSVLLPSGERLIAYLSDFNGEDGAAERRSLFTGEGLWRALRKAPRLHALCAEHGWRPHGAVQGADASSTELDHVGAERWLAVGDAALAFDPLSSKGIANALYTGVRAAGRSGRASRAIQKPLTAMLGICGRFIGFIGSSVGGSMRWRGGGRRVGFGGGPQRSVSRGTQRVKRMRKVHSDPCLVIRMSGELR